MAPPSPMTYHWWQLTGVLPMGNSTWSGWKMGTKKEEQRRTQGTSVDARNPSWYSYGHLPVITGYKWDYTFYKWGYKYL